jgi:hypothetical protein
MSNLNSTNGWDFNNQTTKDLIRDAGWALKSGGVSQEEFMNITSFLMLPLIERITNKE